MKENVFKKSFSHTLSEIGISNVAVSIKNNFKELQKPHDSIHEFIYLAPLCVPSNKSVSWHQKSAFLTYQFDIFDRAHRAFLEALAGYYNTAYTLLRNTLELLLRGAFWECLAHKEFRENASILNKERKRVGGRKRNLLDWFSDIFKLKPEIEHDFEETSAAIFDKIAPIFKDKELQRLIPNLKTIISQLAEWKILDPISNPAEIIYEDIYRKLSKDVHVIPDKTDIGRRLLLGKDLFETSVISEELIKFANILHEVMDIGIVIELNILSDWVRQSEEVKINLRRRLGIVEDLGLKFSSKKLKTPFF